MCISFSNFSGKHTADANAITTVFSTTFSTFLGSFSWIYLCTGFLWNAHTQTCRPTGSSSAHFLHFFWHGRSGVSITTDLHQRFIVDVVVIFLSRCSADVSTCSYNASGILCNLIAFGLDMCNSTTMCLTIQLCLSNAVGRSGRPGWIERSPMG